MFGFGFTFGKTAGFVNRYIGLGSFFFDVETSDEMTEGWTYASFIYQISFATTANSIVSAGMAERVRLKGYIVFSFFSCLWYILLPAHWLWAEEGLLFELGVIDWAGCAAVHLVGGIGGFVATLYLKPRQGRFGSRGKKQLSSPTNAILGAFMLWWGWLAFNTGSTYGVSHGKWQLAVKSAVATICASTGGGLTALLISKVFVKNIQVDMIIDGLLASLVSSTACCSCYTTWQALVVGSIGAGLALLTYPVLEWLEVDDPVGIVPVHVVGSIWGMASAGIFAEEDKLNWEVTRGKNGLLYGGGYSLLLSQLLALLVISIWTTVSVLLIIYSLQHSRIGLRLTKYEEEIGADLREHGLSGLSVNTYRVEKKLSPEMPSKNAVIVTQVYSNIKIKDIPKWEAGAAFATRVIVDRLTELMDQFDLQHSSLTCLRRQAVVISCKAQVEEQCDKVITLKKEQELRPDEIGRVVFLHGYSETRTQAEGRNAFVNIPPELRSLPTDEKKMRKDLVENTHLGEFYGAILHELLHSQGAMHFRYGVMSGKLNITNWLFPDIADERFEKGGFVDPHTQCLLYFSRFTRFHEERKLPIMFKADKDTMKITVKCEDPIAFVSFFKDSSYTENHQFLPPKDLVEYLPKKDFDAFTVITQNAHQFYICRSNL
ncbi:unnamed protein product [Caenorhabditis auriculariae]|uniref:Ammonium transporter AmtB-like domain-containing protein n=1 Tax=Caenorhabditis auriculariae TaxID=2777116 RepID=A0A8S1GPK4_9PELO|nr:unnamed protein product [Caenorhabditis auriculariae]